MANRLLRRVRDFAQVKANGVITRATADDCLAMLAIDNHGFEEMDKKLLRTIIEKFGGGPVGINTIAAAISEEVEAIEDIYEPFLIQKGFLHRTPRGRDGHPLGLRAFGLPDGARSDESDLAALRNRTLRKIRIVLHPVSSWEIKVTVLAGTLPFSAWAQTWVTCDST